MKTCAQMKPNRSSIRKDSNSTHSVRDLGKPKGINVTLNTGLAYGAIHVEQEGVLEFSLYISIKDETANSCLRRLEISLLQNCRLISTVSFDIFHPTARHMVPKNLGISLRIALYHD